MNITYRNEGNILIPNLTVPKSPEKPIGSYGRMRKVFLKNYHPGIYSAMMIKGTLLNHLAEVDETCHKEYIERVKQIAEAQGVTEELKKTDRYKWTGLMNNIGQSVREQILREFVYAEEVCE